MRPQIITAVMLSAASICGCGSLSEGLSVFKPFQKTHVIADAKNPAVEVACVWQPGEGRGLKGVPARGFEGQMFFFTSKDAEPALVNGSLRVYLFADRGTPEERAKPLKEYDYTPRELNSQAKMTSLGPGYSLFVPYPDPEAYQVRCQLRVRFVPAEGPVVWSEALTMILEGPPRPDDQPNSWSTDEARQLVGQGNHIEISKRSGTPAQLRELGESAPPRKLRSDTFNLPQVQQASHEAANPRSELPQAEAAEVSASPRRLETRASELPSGSRTAARSMRSASQHPLAAATAKSDEPGSRWHPLTRQNSATMENPPRYLLSHPIANPEAGATPAEGSATDGSGTAPSQHPLSHNEAELQAKAVQLSAMREGLRAVPPDATPVYGNWQSREP